MVVLKDTSVKLLTLKSYKILNSEAYLSETKILKKSESPKKYLSKTHAPLNMSGVQKIIDDE